MLQPELKHRAVQERECQEKTVARRRFDGSEEVKVVKLRGHRRYWLHTTRGNTATEDRLQTEARFILGEDLHGQPVAIVREQLGQLGRQDGWKLRHGLWTFFS
jgi:hypothetical protein